MRHLRSLATLSFLCLFLSGCASAGWFDRGPHPLSKVDRENAAVYLDVAEDELAAGDPWRALDRLIAVREVPNLPPEVRMRSEELIDAAAEDAIQSARGAEDLEELYDLELSPRMRARAGVSRAEALLAEGSRIKAWKQVRDVEETVQNHGERSRAGAVLQRAGLSLIEDPGRYYLFLRYATRGAAALEYLVLTYPLDPACPRAYEALARHYEREDELELAIERHEDLIYYHPGSPEAAISEAAIPRLRLEHIDRVTHDRGEVARALKEAQSWIARHPDHALLEEVQATEQRAFRRLADNDLILSDYYARIGEPYGARLHAERAASEARQAGDEGRAAKADERLQGMDGASAETTAP
jgi:hypothetical protein